MIKQNVENLLKEIGKTNAYGENITLVGATKYVPAENVNLALSAGLKDIGENKAQELRDKLPLLKGDFRYHFFGRLQQNKIKYLVGKCYLIQSVDSIDLLKEIDKQASKLNVIQNVLIELNLGEAQKGGISFNDLKSVLSFSESLNNVCVLGLMAMLPDTNDQNELTLLAKKVRKFYDGFKQEYSFKYLSMGMSGDYKLCLKCGSNMIRIGTKIFGERL